MDQGGDRRYIVRRNETKAKKDAADRRFVRKAKADSAAFEIDIGNLAKARFDGIFVMRTNARITPLQAVLQYRDLLQVEALFRSAKATMRTRPIYHSSDATVRGRVFCSFLALVLRKDLEAVSGRVCRWDVATCRASLTGYTAPRSNRAANHGLCA